LPRCGVTRLTACLHPRPRCDFYTAHKLPADLGEPEKCGKCWRMGALFGVASATLVGPCRRCVPLNSFVWCSSADDDLYPGLLCSRRLGHATSRSLRGPGCGGATGRSVRPVRGWSHGPRAGSPGGPILPRPGARALRLAHGGGALVSGIKLCQCVVLLCCGMLSCRLATRATSNLKYPPALSRCSAVASDDPPVVSWWPPGGVAPSGCSSRS